MIQPVIARPERQAAQVDKLVEYCRCLDGTEVKVVPVSDDGFISKYPKNRHGCIAAYSLQSVAAAMNGKPFIWMEPDSVPLLPGWAKYLSDEYERGKKPFMLSGDSNPPFDLVGGVGIYDSCLVLKLIPDTYETNSWDLWMLKNIPEMIHFTPLIQHSYGRYTRLGVVEPNRFPRDSKKLRRDAVIFHADKFQELMRTDLPEPSTRGNHNRFLHSGDFGDIIAALPAIEELGGGDLVITNKRGTGQREPMTRERFRLIEPLLSKQPYLSSVTFEESPKDITRDFTMFRSSYHPAGQNLAQWQAAYIGVKVDLSKPWLTVESKQDQSYAAISRSARYHNSKFPWREIISKLGDKALFIGTSEEREAIESEYGGNLKHAVTPNLLDVAVRIYASKMFIGNQSCPFWIAAGLGISLIQEVCPERIDSIILREDAHYPQSDFDFRKIIGKISF